MEKLTKIANINLKKSMENIGTVRFVPYSTSKNSKRGALPYLNPFRDYSTRRYLLFFL
jgi:hypothetical protein